MSDDYFVDFESPYYQMILNGKTNLQIADPGIGFLVRDPGREYRRNNYGYRSEEFSNNADILVVGCSHTFGTGLDENLRWGDVLAGKLGLIPQTIAEAGMSISWLVEKVISHISIFGAPQKIVCLFPDPNRFSAVIDSKTLSSDSLNMGSYVGQEKLNNSERGQKVIHSGHEESNNKDVTYIKRPFNAKFVITRDMALHQSIRSIRFLEKYCNDLKIPLIWGTWDNNFSEIANAISTTDYRFDNFIDVGNRGCANYTKITDQPKDVLFESNDSRILNCKGLHKNIECDCHLVCHEDYRKLIGSDQFYLAADVLDGAEHAHFGAHLHMHFAEAFLSEC